MPAARTGARATMVLYVCAALAACGGKDAPTGPNDGPSFPEPANPVTVSVTTDAARGVTATVPVSGGTIVATGADGSRFTLTIPANALLQATTITVTPVSAVAGMPMSGGLVAAVSFAPEGLRLYEPATLLIEPARTVSPREQVGFGFYGNGTDFHLAPLAMGAPIQLRVFHFSGVGLAQGTSADVAAQQDHAPASLEAQLTQEIAALVEAERAAQLLGEPGDPNFGPRLAELMDQYFDGVVDPKLEAASKSTDLAVIRDALVTALSWERMSQLLGIDTGANWSRIVSLMETLLTRVFNDAYTRCKANPTGAMTEASIMTEASRMAQLLGIAAEGDPRFDFNKVIECAMGSLPPRVQLRIDATFVEEDDFLGGGIIRYTSSSTSTILLDRQSTGSFYQGSGTIQYTSFTINSSANTEVEQTPLGTTDGKFVFLLVVNADGTIKIDRGTHADDGAVRPTETFSQTGRGDKRYLDVASATSYHWVQGWDQLFASLESFAMMPTGLSLAPPGTYASTISRTNLNPGGSPYVAQATVTFTLNPNP